MLPVLPLQGASCVPSPPSAKSMIDLPDPPNILLLINESFSLLRPTHFSLSTFSATSTIKIYLGHLQIGNWGEREYSMLWKTVIQVKNYLGKTQLSILYVTQNKNIKYFWNCFGWTKGLQGTQNGCEMLKKTKISFSPTSGLTRVSWSPLLRPKQF